MEIMEDSRKVLEDSRIYWKVPEGLEGSRIFQNVPEET